MILGIGVSEVSEHRRLHCPSKVPSCMGDAWLRESHLKSAYVPPKQAISQAKKMKKKSETRESKARCHVIFSSLPAAWLSVVSGSDSRLTQVVSSICRLLQQVRVGRLHAPEDRTLNPGTHRGFSALVSHLARCSPAARFFFFFQHCRKAAAAAKYWLLKGAKVIQVDDQRRRWHTAEQVRPSLQVMTWIELNWVAITTLLSMSRLSSLLCVWTCLPGTPLIPWVTWCPFQSKHYAAGYFIGRFWSECKAAFGLCNLKVGMDGLKTYTKLLFFYIWYHTKKWTWNRTRV